ALDHRKLVAENAELRRRLLEQTADSQILGKAPSMQRVMETIVSVADTDANVLIVGESGTGKELIANALHEKSRRRDGPWIKINCAALPKDLIESELFGHMKDRKSTRLNSSHEWISYAVFCLKKQIIVDEYC